MRLLGGYKLVRKPGERSFTLIETVLAIGLLTTVLMEVSFVQAKYLNFSIYYRKSTQAIWLAKALMAEVEYKSNFYPLKDIRAEPGSEERPVPPTLCPKDPQFDCDFTYSMSIEEFKLPIVEMLTGSIAKETEGADGFTSVIKDQVEAVLGKEIFKIANVVVSWPEGSKRSQVNVPYLLTSQQNIDSFIEALPPPTAADGTGTATGTGTDTGTGTATGTGAETEPPPPQPPVVEGDGNE